MPYEIRMQGGKHCVYNKDTGDNKGCSDTHAMAVKRMRALYAHEKSADIKNLMLSTIGPLQPAFDLEVLQKQVDAALDGFDWEGVLEAHEVGIQQIKEGLQTNHDADTQPKRGILFTIVDMFKGQGPHHPPVSGGPLYIYKQADSRLRVIMRVSNIFKDRHGEIITSEAHKEYVNWVDAGKGAERMPEFWLWHTNGTRWGKADGLAFDDNFLLATGLVDEDSEYIAEALSAKGIDIGISHGFFGFSLENKGYIDLYRSFEFSPLPIDQAANIWTAYMLAKEADLPISDAKRKFFIEDLGIPETFISKVEQENKEESAAIKALGIAYKEDVGAPDGNSGQTSNGDNTSQPNADSDSAVQPTLAGVLAKVNEIATELGVVKAKQLEFEAKSKDVVADALSAAIVSGKGYVPSQAKDNAAKDNDVQAQKTDWFKDVVLDPMASGRS